MYNKGLTGKTSVCGIIGNPVEHTISPAMQNAAFQSMRLDYIYVPFKVKREDLKGAISGMRSLNIRGLNVTIPHKVEVIPFVDEIDDFAEKIGSINTIVNTNGLLKGYNTDASGFWHMLRDENVSPERKKVVLLGAGGASRAIAFVLADKGADLTIINRTSSSARRLADQISGIFSRRVQDLELNESNLETALKKAEIIINTTSIGMMPDPGMSVVPARLICKGMIVIDIVYNPPKTRFLVEAEKMGARVIGGIEMLVQQGAAAFELWTGKRAPVDVIREVASAALSGGESG